MAVIKRIPSYNHQSSQDFQEFDDADNGHKQRRQGSPSPQKQVEGFAGTPGGSSHAGNGFSVEVQ